MAQRVQVRYRGLEEKLVAGSSVDSNVVDLTEDCTAGADEVIGLPPGLGSDGTSETTVRSTHVLALYRRVLPLWYHACRALTVDCG